MSVTIEPPIVGRHDPRNSHLAAAQIEPDRATGRARVLRLLSDEALAPHGGGWVPAEEIIEVGGSEGLRRLRELRQFGHVIEARPPLSGKGPWEYRLAAEQRRATG